MREAAFNRATAAIDALRRGGRASEATLAEAMHAAVRGDGDRVVDSLHALLDRPDMPFSGWTIPIEPLLAPFRKGAGLQQVAARLADRAR